MAIATTVTEAIIGCLSLGGGSRKANIATVIQTAYDFISPEQSEVAGGELNAGCDAVTNAASASASQVGCTDCSLPDASAGCGGCNEDARCDKCSDCMDGK